MDRNDPVAPKMMRPGNSDDFWSSKSRISKGAAPFYSYLYKFPEAGIQWDEKAAYTHPECARPPHLLLSSFPLR